MSKRDETHPENTHGYTRYFIVWICSIVTTLDVVIGTQESDPIVAVAYLTIATTLFAIIASAFRSGAWTVVGMTVAIVALALLW